VGNTHHLPLASSFGLALIGVMFSYGGFQNATFIAAEVKNAQKNIPKSLLLGVSVVTLCYVVTNITYLRLLPMAKIIASRSVASDAVSSVWAVGASFIALLIIISVLGTIGIYILTSPRIYFAMADDGLFFKSFAYIHPRYKTPYYGILFQGIWAIVLLLFWKTFSDLITYVIFIDIGLFFLAASTIFVFRKRQLVVEGAYRSWAYPVAPLIFMGMCLFIFGNTLIQKPTHAIAGLVFLGMGVLVFYAFKAFKTQKIA
jgi:basic amino acid/polyamine antiporter, APA family